MDSDALAPPKDTERLKLQEGDHVEFIIGIAEGAPLPITIGLRKTDRPVTADPPEVLQVGDIDLDGFEGAESEGVVRGVGGDGTAVIFC